MNVGLKIKQLRKQRGMTLEELGDKVGVGKSTIRKWEEGVVASMKSDRLAKIADVFGVDPTYFLFDDNDNGKKSYYLDDKTAEMAQTIFENKELRLLFDAGKDAKPDDLKTVTTMLLALKAKDGG